MSLQFWALWLTLWGRMGMALLTALPFAFTWPLEMWVRLHYGSPISANFVALAFETNAAELVNLVSSLGWLVWLPVAWLFLYVWAVWLSFRWRLRWRGPLRWVGLALLVATTASLSFTAAPGEDGWLTEGSPSDALGLNARRGLGGYWASAFPVNQIVALQTFRRERRSMEAIRTKIQQYRFGAYVPDPQRAATTVVLVIGESSTAQRWSLLGYGQETNPRLKSLPLSMFSNVASVSSMTRIAVPAALAHRPVLTSAGLVDADAQPSLVQAFNEAGYDTYWFSNQAAMGPHDSSIAIYAAEAKYSRFLNPGASSSRGSLDELLLPALDGALAAAGPKLIVLHTLGSHFDQSLRYPAAFAHFLPAPGATEGGSQSSSSRTQMEQNAYDNSVLYTDHVLAEVIERVKSLDDRAVVAYFSDHGVDAHRTPCQSDSMIARVTKASRHVPVFFWMSSAFRDSNPSLPKRLQDNRDQPYTTAAIFGSLLEISGVSLRSASLETLESLLRAPTKNLSPRKHANAFANSCEFDSGSL